MKSISIPLVGDGYLNGTVLHADLVTTQVFGLVVERVILRADQNGLLLLKVRVREIDGLQALLGRGHTGDDNVKITLGEVDAQVVERHVDDLEGNKTRRREQR